MPRPIFSEVRRGDLVYKNFRFADEKTGRMQKAAVLVSLLLLGWTWTLQGLPALPGPLYPTQENFDISQFLGTWHDVAVATTDMQRDRGDAAIGKLVLQRGTTEGKIKATKTGLRDGTCEEMTGDYELTETPGRFFYHIEKWGADVDAYVVQTNYNEYAIMIMNKAKSTGDKSTAVKLYSRTKTVRATVLEDFKRLVREQGMSDDTIVNKKDKGDCVPRQQVTAGDDAPLFNGTEACSEAPDKGPCFALVQRYYYNHTSMSCELFEYGGCLGNKNNFESKRECLQRCRIDEACSEAPDKGPCFALVQRYYFNHTSMSCELFKYGGCLGNQNNFESERECLQRCRTEDDLPKSN